MNEPIRVDRGTEKDHQIIIKGRKTIDITGVKEIDSFDNEEFLLETNMGYLVIRGQQLQLKNLNVAHGQVEIKGSIDDLTYVDEGHSETAKGFFSKLFR